MLSWVGFKSFPWRLIGVLGMLLALFGWHVKTKHDAVVADRAFQQVVAQQIEINNSKELRDRETKNLRRMEINSTNAAHDSSTLRSANNGLDAERDRLRDAARQFLDRQPSDAATECANDAKLAGAVELFGAAADRATSLAKEAGRLGLVAREGQSYGQACYELTKPL